MDVPPPVLASIVSVIQGLGLDEVIAEVMRMQDAQPSHSGLPPSGELKVSRRHDAPAEQVARSLMTGEFDDTSHGDRDSSDSSDDSSGTVDLPADRSWSDVSGSGSGSGSKSGSGRLSDVFSVSPAMLSMPGSAVASESSRTRRHTYWHSVARIGALFVFIGFNMTFFNQFILGTRGMPRRYYTYATEYQTQHQLSTFGALILGVGLFVHLIVLLMSLKNGKKAPQNPWGAATIEWQTSSPPALHNFDTPPVIPPQAFLHLMIFCSIFFKFHICSCIIMDLLTS